MDRAPAAPEGDDAASASGRPPAIGVPSIPTRADRRPAPAVVPSVQVPPRSQPHPDATPGTEPTGSVGTWTALEVDPVTGGPAADEPVVDAGLTAPTTRRRPTVPVVSTRSMPLPTDRMSSGVRTRADAPADAGGEAIPDPFDVSFPPGVASKLGWYVYLLTDPGSGRPFYVGRGRGDRCFRHLEAARTTPVPTGVHADRTGEGTGPAPVAPGESGGASDDADGATFPALALIREVEARGASVLLEILRYDLTAKESRLVEAATVDLLDLPVPAELGSQRQPAADLGTRLAKRAKFKRDHQVVLLRVGDRGADTGYETARHDWRIGRRWTDPQSSRSPRWAVIVAGELVVAVYAIERWEPTPLPGPPGPSGEAGARAFTARSTYRHSFIGTRDEELEARYVGRSVGAYLGAGPGRGPVSGRGRGVGVHNQVTYVWCGPHWVNPVG